MSAGKTLFVLLFAAGCSVPAQPRLNRKVQELEKSYKAAAGRVETDPGRAFSDLKKVEAAARKLVSRLLIGDPRRQVADGILAEARETIRAIEESRAAGADTEEILSGRAELAIEQGRNSTAEVKGRPQDVDMSRIDKAAALVVGRGRAPAPILREADADFDRPGLAHRRRGDREGDVKDEPVAKKVLPRRAAVKPTGPVTVQKIDRKGKFLTIHFTFVNKGALTQIGSVTGTIFDRDGKRIANIVTAYLAEGFEPDWKDIFNSTGTAVTGWSVAAPRATPIRLVAVAHSDRASKAERARVTVTTTDWRSMSGEGPR